MTFQIIPAKAQYIDQVSTVTNSYLIDRLSENEIKKHGFLVSDFNQNAYLDYLGYADYFYLYIVNGNVAGFILAYSDQYIKENEWLNGKVKSKESEPFVLIKQICVAKEYLGKGIAKKLYEFLFEQMKQSICYAVIVIEPLNLPSINVS